MLDYKLSKLDDKKFYGSSFLEQVEYFSKSGNHLIVPVSFKSEFDDYVRVVLGKMNSENTEKEVFQLIDEVYQNLEIFDKDIIDLMDMSNSSTILDVVESRGRYLSKTLFNK